MSNWVLTSSDNELLNDVIAYEGTIKYQTAVGYFKNNKFWTYKDSRGYPTIGYGHLITASESFPNGITETQANNLLEKDVDIAVQGAMKLYNQYSMVGNIQLQRVLTQMVYQMGLTKVSKFKETLTAMGNENYQAAANGMRNSAWYHQSTSRAEALAKIVESL